MSADETAKRQKCFGTSFTSFACESNLRFPCAGFVLSFGTGETEQQRRWVVASSLLFWPSFAPPIVAEADVPHHAITMQQAIDTDGHETSPKTQNQISIRSKPTLACSTRPSNELSLLNACRRLRGRWISCRPCWLVWMSSTQITRSSFGARYRYRHAYSCVHATLSQLVLTTRGHASCMPCSPPSSAEVDPVRLRANHVSLV